MNKDHIAMVLMTLSFFEPLSFERIIFDFDLEKVKTMPDFASEDLKEILSYLVKTKQIKKIKVKDVDCWIKIQPRNKLSRKLKRILSFLKIKS